MVAQASIVIAVVDAVVIATIAEMSRGNFTILAPVRLSTAPHIGLAVIKLVVTNARDSAIDGVVVDNAA